MRDWYFMELGGKAPFVLDVSGSTLKRGMIKEVSLRTFTNWTKAILGIIYHIPQIEVWVMEKGRIPRLIVWATGEGMYLILKNEVIEESSGRSEYKKLELNHLNIF